MWRCEEAGGRESLVWGVGVGVGVGSRGWVEAGWKSVEMGARTEERSSIV